jgi:hypothetical protein
MRAPDGCRRLALGTVGGVVLLAGAVASSPATRATVLDGCGISDSQIDLNGDGFDDAVVGDPFAAVGNRPQAGRIIVLFGDADGRIGEGTRRALTQADFGEEPEAGDHFGWSVAVGRADQLGFCASILVGAPGEDLAGAADAGAAHLGTFETDDEGRPTQVVAATLTQAEAGGAVEAGDEFGYAVVLAGPTQPDPYQLVVGSPGETVGTAEDAGAIDVFRVQGSPSGVGEYVQGRVANSGGDRVPGTPEPGDRFGSSLAADALDLGEVSQSFVVGAPGDAVNGRDAAGTVTVFEGEDGDGPFSSVTQLSEASAGVPGVAEAGDQFGFSLALSSFSSSFTPRALAVGVPGEDRGSVVDAGAVTLFTNKANALVARANLTQATEGVPGALERGDRFGHSVAFQFSQRLLVGVPFEDIGRVRDAGQVQSVEVTPEEFPLRFGPAINEDADGTAYAVAVDSRFGYGVSGLVGVRENVFTVSSPFQGEGSVYVVSDRSRSDGSPLAPRAWVPGDEGIPSSPGGTFGWSVSGATF